MKKIKSIFHNLIAYLKDDNISIDYKSLYVTSLLTIPASIMFIVAFVLFDVDEAVAALLMCLLVFYLGLSYLLHRFDQINYIKYLLSLVINILVFPICYVITGDVYNGTLLFFPLGIILTFFMIRGRIVYLFAIVELIWYCFIISGTRIHYIEHSVYRDVTLLGPGIPTSFIAAALVPLGIIVYQAKENSRANKKIEESYAIIKEAKNNKTRFLSNMTNEIRTPMNSIVGMNELILQEDLDAQSREYAENIRNSSNQLLKIINNILEFSKLDSNKMELFPAKYDFKKLLTDIIYSVSVEYASDDNEFYVNVDSNIPKILFGDSLRIKQVFLYILFSTISKLPHNRISLKVEGDIDRTTNTVLMSCTIAESGLGLSDNEIEAMLSAYTRYDSRQKFDFMGMGLEMSICKEILEMMGGSLSIDSLAGVGVSIKFQFINYIIEDSPLAKISYTKESSVLVCCSSSIDSDIFAQILSDFQIFPNIVSGPSAFRNAIESTKYTHIFIYDMFYSILKDTIKEAGIEENVFVVTKADSVYSDFGKCKILRSPITCINLISALNDEWKADAYKVALKKQMVVYPQAKVLVVDDSIVNLKVLDGMLSTFEITTKTAKSGAEALEILREEEFDLLILDQKMPEMDGIELLHLIRKLGNVNSLLPILCATADFGPDISRYLIAEGFQDYLAKPVRRFYLERMLRKFMPVELAVNIRVDVEEADDKPHSKKKDEVKVAADNSVEVETKPDPQVIEFDVGIGNVGGSEDAFGDVLQSFYKEGIAKMDSVPPLLKDDLRLYVIEVHALKSSNAAIGAKGMSEQFKSLEFAGRAENIEYLEGHTAPTFEEFAKVLEQIKQYLVAKGLYQEESVDDQPEGDAVKLTKESVSEVIEYLAKFNLKAAEDALKEMKLTNYGADINKRIKSINDAYEQFDYHRVRDELKELEESL